MARQAPTTKPHRMLSSCNQPQLQIAHVEALSLSKHSISGIKSASRPINTCASSSYTNSNLVSAGWPCTLQITLDGEAASLTYLTNALGQQVFKSEPKPDQYLPSQSELGAGFIAWLKTNFGWLYAQAQTDASLGSAYVYADGPLPSWAVLGEYDNGSASGAGRTEYIWLPTEDGGAVPVGMFRNSKFFAIHTDHLGTPRQVTDNTNKPVWQWPYSAFGNNKPTGILKPTTSATGAFTNQPNLLATQTPAAVMDLRFPGQMADEETGLFYNYFRNYQPNQGRYTQGDPIGLAGGLNRFGYANQNALSYTDPLGLWSLEGGVYIGLGASVSLGRDPNTGGTFMSFKFGKGFGWGATYDPLGGRAGGVEEQSCRAGVGVGLYAETGGNAGPVSGKIEANLGRNFFFGGGNDIYGGVQPKGTVDTNIRGIKGVAAAGIEITVFGARPSR